MYNTISSRLISLAIVFISQTIICLAQDKLSGTATVSPTGAAVYSVAIEAPKGVGDLMPSIGIAYNSQSGNGLAGFGCNLTGLSAITRGMKTVAHDNTSKGISYDNNCALYLDGKRLLLKSGTEGTDGCVYAPEGEPLTNVTLHNSLTNTTCWFEIDTNDGMVYEYGHNDGCQLISNPAAVAAWYISKATNPMGQTINYQYSNDGLYLYPQTISYGGDNSVNFTYENRSDSIFFTLGNQRGYIAKRLKTISTKAGSATYRTYTMSYNMTSDGSTTKFSRLTKIHETGENGSSSHDLTAQWNYLPNVSESCHESVVNLPSSSGVIQYGYRFLFAGDLNNDGISDIIHVSPLQLSSGTCIDIRAFKSHIHNGTVSFQSNALPSLPPDYKIADIENRKGQSFIVDINGDGKNDFVYPCITNNTYNGSYILRFKYFPEGQSSSQITPDIPLITGDEMPLYTITDINGNGKNDIIFLEKQGVNNSYALHLAEYSGGEMPSCIISLTLQSSPKHLFTSDFNHDGLTDLMILSDTGYRIFYNQGGNLLQSQFVNSSTLNTCVTNHERIDQGDFNGDGILDFIWNDNNSSQLFFELGNADGTFTRQLAYNLDFNVIDKNKDEGTWNCLITDIDHDGKSDVVLNVAQYYYYITFQKTHTYWLLSNGTSLTKMKESTSSRKDDAKVGHLFAGDFKGNGYFDVANYGYDCYNGIDANVDPTVNIYSCSNHNISNGKVSQFQDSNGRKAVFNYCSMTSDLVYTKGTGSSYPLLDVAAPLCVTSQITESGGSPIITQTNYTYKGLRANLQGRGLLGFKEVTATESNSGKIVKTAVNAIDYTYCVPTHTTITTTQGGMTETIADSMKIKTSSSFSAIPNSNYMLQRLFRTKTDIYNHEATTYYSYDETHHSLTNEFTVYDENFLMFKEKEQVYSPNKIAGAYRPVSIFIRQMHPDGGDYYEAETRYTYDSYGRTTSMTEFPGENLELVTTYQYDSYGNVTKEKHSGYGISNDTETNYQYSSNGKFLTGKSDIAQTISYSRNAFGDITAETDLTNASNSLTTTYSRNGFGTLSKEIKPTGEITTWVKENATAYGGSYCITATSNNAPTVKTWYDALDNKMRIETTGIGGVEISTTNTYNTSGLLLTKTKVKGNLTTTENYTYDALGRMTASTSSNGTSVAYAYNDREASTTKNGQTYTKYYDAWGNVVQSDDPVSSVTYSYNAIGNPIEIETEGKTVRIAYDDYGNQISLEDPDAGLTTYQYDALHRIISQTDARNYTTTFSYDGAGRITQKTVGGTTTSYTYGTSGNGAGRLVSEQTDGCAITYAYDNKGRLSQETRSMLGEPSVIYGYTYNSNGTLASKTYPQGVTIDYVYNDDHCIAIKMGSTNICFINQDNGLKKDYSVGGLFRCERPMIDADNIGDMLLNYEGSAQLMGSVSLNSVNPYKPVHPIPEDPDPDPDPDELIYYVLGPAMEHSEEYDARGYLMKLATARDCMTFSFQSGTSNLLSRTGMTSQTETFTYDDLDRLTQVSGGDAQTVSYLDDGNIYEKTGPGVYTYGQSHPHAVTNVTNPLGSISSTTQTAAYTPFGKIETLSDNGYVLSFTYGPDEERWKTVLQHNGTTIRTTLYADGYERITENGQTRHFYYLDGGVIYVLNDGETNGTFYYSFTDHLGSITRIYTKNGTKVFSAEYDAWGKQTVTTNTLGFHRGYTGHEMLPEFGLINMNGRLYDPILGRFLSPDNYVQLPDFSQSFNRYSYCLNNPLKYTDPSGEIVWWVAAIVVGGTLNAAFNADNINNFGDFFKFFAVGTAAGLAGGYVGNLVSGAIATGGFCGGFLVGGASGAAGGLILGGGNSWLSHGSFGDILSNAFLGAALGGLTGGLIGGVTSGIKASKQNCKFLTGKPKMLSPQVNINTEQMEAVAPKLPHKQNPVIQIQSNGHNYELNPDFKITHDNYIPESKGSIINRPSIEGYANRDWSKDIYHNFPRDLDNTIVNQGIYISNQGKSGFVYPGYVDGKMGYYNIIMDEYNIVRHRMFYPMNKVHQIWVGSDDFKIFPR